jgi:transcriptional regulator with XRE-family HTH domain
MTEPLPPASNTTIAEKIGCDYTTVSRLRSGQRVPSLELALRIVQSYELSEADQVEFWRVLGDPKSCGEFLTNRVFGPALLPG